MRYKCSDFHSSMECRMDENEMDSVIHIIMDGVILLCYLIGIGFVLILQRRRKAKVQHLLWLNLSIYVVLLNSVYIFWEIWDFGKYDDSDLLSLIIVTFQLSLNCYIVLAMISISIDRLLLILLNIKYPLYVTKKRVLYIILATWVACLVTFLLVLFNSDLKNPLDSVDYIFSVFDRYIDFSLDVIYTGSSVYIYSVIFYHFAMSKKNPQLSKNNATTTNRIKDMYKAFRRSRFYFAFLLVLSYTLLISIPDVIRRFLTIDPKYMIVAPILVRVSWFIDAVIFMCMNLEVRQLIRGGRVRYSSRVGVYSERNIAMTTSTM